MVGRFQLCKVLSSRTKVGHAVSCNNDRNDDGGGSVGVNECRVICTRKSR
jgi:hypothetical protein